MKHYRSYMDRITAPAGLRQRVLEAAEQGARPRRPARRLTLRLAALSACCVLAVAGGRLLWLGGSAPIPNPTAGMAATPAPASSTPAVEYTLTIPPGTGGSFWHVDRVVEATDCTGSTPLSLDYAWDSGSFVEPLSAEEISTALGGSETELLWRLFCPGFGLDGTVRYSREGDVLLLTITGTGEAGTGEDASFTLELCPGQLPPSCTVYQEAVPQEYEGVSITKWLVRTEDEPERYLLGAELMAGDTGLRFTCRSESRDTAETLTDVLIGLGLDSDCVFTTDHLTLEDPVWEYYTLPDIVSPSPTPWQVYPLE